MPSIYVHNYFAKEIQNKLNETKNKKIKDPTYFYIFAQSFDNLFYYDFFKPLLGIKYRKLGHYAHAHNTWKYFESLLKNIKNNNLYNDETLGYLYGSLAHYALDSTEHPYIHYISGRYSKSDKKNTKKYRGYHTSNEIMLDAIYYYKDHKNSKYYNYKLYKDLIPKLSFSKDLTNLISNTFKETFGVDNLGVIYNKSYNHSRLAYKYLMFDRFNIKRIIYKGVDLAYPFKRFKANSYSHHINVPNMKVLNTSHETWLHPITGEEHNESFYDLYDIALKKVMNYIDICNKYFDNKCSLKKVEKVIGNINYSSGLDCDIRAKFKYFKH